MLGGTFFKRLEVEFGYRLDRISVRGGTSPNLQADPRQLAGLTLRINRDTLDAQEYPSNGMSLRFQMDRRSVSMGSDFDYWKWQLDIDRFLPLTGKSTLAFRGTAGYTEGNIPFYDSLYVGGFTFSDGGPRQLLGYSRDELLARQLGIASLSYRREMFARPISFAKRIFLTGSYNVAAVSVRESSPYRFALYHGAGVGALHRYGARTRPTHRRLGRRRPVQLLPLSGPRLLGEV